MNDQGRVASEWRRMAADEARAARDDIDSAADPRADRPAAIHSSRKHIRKARALLRLVRSEIGAKAFRRHNVALRDAARTLSPIRDADVIVETIRELRPTGDAAKSLRQLLTTERRTLRAKMIEDGSLQNSVARTLERFATELRDLSLRDGDWSVLRDGLEDSYRRARRAHRSAFTDGADAALHDARKRAKDLWYHLRVVRPIAPNLLKPMEQDAHALADALGADHDLAVLTERADAAEAGDDGLTATIVERRQAHQTEARRIGNQLFAESPRAYVRRLAAYWSAWRTAHPEISAELDPEHTSAEDLQRLASKNEIIGRSAMTKRQITAALATQEASGTSH